MAESTLTLKRDDLRRAIGNMLGRGVDITNWDDADFATRVDLCVDVGCRNVYEPEILPNETQVHVWSFLQPKLTTIRLNKPYSTGTISVAAGTVTGVGTVFPSWAASGELAINGVRYKVATRVSNTSLTLSDTTVTAPAGTQYTLVQVDYVLPDLFGGFRGDLTLSITANVRGITLQRSTKEELIALQNSNAADYAGQPTQYAVFAAEQTGAADQKTLLTVYPFPDAEYSIVAFAVINPYQLTSALPYPMGGLPLSECLREAVLAAAEVEFQGQLGVHNQLFRSRLAAAISYDRQMNNPGIMGQNLDQTEQREFWRRLGPRTIHVGLGPTTYAG